MTYLSKSDFKVAQNCPTKLYYKKNNYTSLNEQNEYLALLADGGFMIGKLAQLLFPDGIAIVEGKGMQNEAIRITEKLLSENENIILFEPAILINNQLVRIDILEKKGNQFNLIEVKSKSYNSEELKKSKEDETKTPYWLSKDFPPYLEDIAYQKQVLQDKYPGSQVNAYLMMPDKSKINEHENLIQWFRLSKKDKGTHVEFIGTEENAAQIRLSNFMGLESVDSEIEIIKEEIKNQSEKYIESLLSGQKIKTPLSYKCAKCEYRVENENSGFNECWGELAKPAPHILDLGQLGNINKRGNCINNLITANQTALSDVPIEAVLGEKNQPYYNDRPLFQLACKEEFMLNGFNDAIRKIEFPIYFIDFETSQMAIPFHAGMKPYQNVIFQWSCHVLHKDGKLEHFEWLNTDDYFPNVEFATTLKNCIGENGTVMTWSSYENTQLKSILENIEESKEFDEDLKKWLSNIIVDKEQEDNRIIDMQKQLALRYYFHPLMGGRTSIKVVLPAVLNATKSNKIKNWLNAENLFKETELGILNPYSLLEKQIIDNTDNQLIHVKNGGDAMVAYRDMQFGLAKDNPAVIKAYSDALRKYCKLDTLAMVIIWEHWQNLVQSGERVTTREATINNL